MALSKPKHPWVQPFRAGCGGGHWVHPSLCCTQPCPFRTRGWVSLWVLVGQPWGSLVRAGRERTRGMA